MSNIICGIDQLTSSTWFAYNKLNGDICFLTNFRNPANQVENKNYGSRGHLVIEYVKINDASIQNKKFKSESDYEKNLFTIVTRGFNIVYGNVFSRKFKYFQYKNTDERLMKESIDLEAGKIYGLSNGGLDQWDKVIRGKQLFEEISEQAEIELVRSQDNDKQEIIQEKMQILSKDLIQLMKNDTKSHWGSVQSGTGYPKIWEFINSSIFACNNLANFCTVSTSIFILHKSNQACFLEQRYRHNSAFLSKLGSSLNICRPRYDVATEVYEVFESKQ
ncbi:UNKNOWN [Stylonychia lemnae]|uniref:Uncharacterized protein n=1 Tax=Stylonychia lemnae TaxID=5949 RepID=A0A078A3L1_STYLE|nr:UNKNOWN [Stylonychia lemnae]|eukprot:CDW75329.1 UNKNOWN [Stylonychia lemnae]